MEFARRPKLACSSLQIVLTFRLSHPLRIFSFHSGRGNSRIPVLRVIEPAAHAEPAQSSPEVVGAVRLPWPHRIWPRLHSDTAVHGHLLPHSLCIARTHETGKNRDQRVGRLIFKRQQSIHILQVTACKTRKVTTPRPDTINHPQKPQFHADTDTRKIIAFSRRQNPPGLPLPDPRRNTARTTTDSAGNRGVKPSIRA